MAVHDDGSILSLHDSAKRYQGFRPAFFIAAP